MPKSLERKLKHEAKTKGLGKKRTQRYVYGTMNELHLLNRKRKRI